MRTLGAEQADEEARLAEAERLQQEVGVWACGRVGGWMGGRMTVPAAALCVSHSILLTVCSRAARFN